MRTLLWLDDARNPFQTDWLMKFAPEFDEQRENVVWVKTYKEFCRWITENGLPEIICFDHDLADRYYDNQTQPENTIWHEKTGYDCAKWITSYCMLHKLKVPRYKVQSANTVGKENIIRFLENYKKHCE